MGAELIAVLESELVLPALFDRHGRRESLLGRVSQDGCSKFFVDQDPRLFLRYTALDGFLEAVVNYLLAGSDLSDLLRRHRFFEAEYLGPVRTSMVERQDVQRLVIT